MFRNISKLTIPFATALTIGSSPLKASDIQPVIYWQQVGGCRLLVTGPDRGVKSRVSGLPIDEVSPCDTGNPATNPPHPISYSVRLGKIPGSILVDYKGQLKCMWLNENGEMDFGPSTCMGSTDLLAKPLHGGRGGRQR